MRGAGFEFVGGVWNAFRGHGYCATDAQRWVRRATESSAIQGPTLHKNTKGTIHPNSAGYHELSRFVVRALSSREENRRPVAVPDTYTTPGNQQPIVKTGGVLVNDTAPDLIAHVSVVNHTQPDGGKVEVKPGSFTYNPATSSYGPRRRQRPSRSSQTLIPEGDVRDVDVVLLLVWRGTEWLRG